VESFKLIYDLTIHGASLDSLLQQPALMRLSRERLKNIREQVEAQIRRYKTLLAPLEWKKIDQQKYMSSYGMPSGSSFLVHNIDNLFRDWCWGEEENKASFACLQKIMSGLNMTSNDHLLVLGSGASRLAYDFHQAFPFAKTFAVDYNPLFHLLVRKILSGESISFCEFPIVPVKAEDFAIERVLRAPSAVRAGFELVLGDITDDTFAWPQSNFILTPWLIDVVAMDFSQLLTRLNRHLSLGGTWINYGPLGFNNPQLQDYYSFEEVNHLLKKHGFKVVDSSYEFAPYLQSPSSNSHRMERVYAFVAEKIAEADEIEAVDVANGLPEWLRDHTKTITIPVQAMRLEEGFAFNVKIVQLLKQNLTFQELVDRLHSEMQADKAQLGLVVHHILLNFYQQSLRNPHDH
jgi:hypothetical protein